MQVVDKFITYLEIKLSMAVHIYGKAITVKSKYFEEISGSKIESNLTDYKVVVLPTLLCMYTCES